MFGVWLIVPALSPYSGGGLLLNPYLAILAILLMGGIIGYLIGTLITVGKMNNFIVTLAMLLILRGLMLAFTQRQRDDGTELRQRRYVLLAWA